MSEYLIAFPSIFCTFIAIALGLFVWSRNFQGTSHRIFALGMAALAVMELGNSLVLLSSSVPAFIFWQRISLFGKVLMPITWLTFSLAFAHPDPKQILVRRRMLLIALLFASLVFLLFTGSDAFLYPGSDTNTSIPVLKLGPVGRWFYIYMLLSSVLILAQLENTFRSASESQRRQIKFLIVGIGTIFAFSIYTSSQTLLFSTIFTQLIPMEAILILIALGMMAYSLVRHKNLEVDLFVSRHVVYGSVIFIASGIYLFAVGLLARILSSFGNRINPFLAPLIILLLISGLVIFLSSSMVRRRLTLFISQHFYKHKYDFHLKWLEATERLGSRQTISDLIS
ncbi:MAG TPA: histidine kinase N-terminal 7TM domain-containing protein, partial [Candidatus Brocadiales bacterium]|nr:histidine kinase N-terminal 7TM domain-containing protein [Candidatus Brocadiales bacterium]